MSSGKIAQVIGPVVDVLFAAGEKLPEINNALVVYKNDEKKTKIVLEVALELGDGMIRTIAMESTDGLTRGMEVLDTGRPISVPPAFSMLETVIAATIRQDEKKRSSHAWVTGIAIFIVGIPSALSFGVWSEFKIFGKTIFDLWDFIISAVIMPIGALSVAVFTSWVQDKQSVLRDAGMGSTIPKQLLYLWLGALRYLAPIAIIVVFINSLGLI